MMRGAASRSITMARRFLLSGSNTAAKSSKVRIGGLHHNTFPAVVCSNWNSNNYNNTSRRYLSFSFSGPKTLDEILKTELVHEKSGTEIADMWYTYHESKESVHGIVLRGEDAKALTRAEDCPFFVQPIFRDDGFFMMVSQYMQPNHFLLAYLEDYKMDPAAAQPLLTFSIFDDYSKDKDITLVRCEILNKGITDEEGYKVVQSLLDSYRHETGYNQFVKPFNIRPNSFNIDDYISHQNQKWNE